MQSNTLRAEDLRSSYTLYILHLESTVLKLRSLLNSTEITGTVRTRLQTVLAETQAELRSLPEFRQGIFWLGERSELRWNKVLVTRVAEFGILPDGEDSDGTVDRTMLNDAHGAVQVRFADFRHGQRGDITPHEETPVCSAHIL